MPESPTVPHAPTFGYERADAAWPLSTKIRRALWIFACTLLFRPTPKRLGNRWRLFVLRCFGATIEGSPLILPSVRILQPWLLTMGGGGALGDQAEIYNYGRITIGENTVISQQAYLCTGTHDFRDPLFPLIWKPITIGSRCWVAARAFVMPGVTIGEGTVVGACSLVNKDLPPWTICSGNPCVVLKVRSMKDETHVN